MKKTSSQISPAGELTHDCPLLKVPPGQAIVEFPERKYFHEIFENHENTTNQTPVKQLAAPGNKERVQFEDVEDAVKELKNPGEKAKKKSKNQNHKQK